MKEADRETVAMIIRHMSDAVTSAWERREASVVTNMETAMSLALTLGLKFPRTTAHEHRRSAAAH